MLSIILNDSVKKWICDGYPLDAENFPGSSTDCVFLYVSSMSEKWNLFLNHLKILPILFTLFFFGTENRTRIK